jgi:glucose/arabinose dehydrogenase
MLRLASMKTSRGLGWRVSSGILAVWSLSQAVLGCSTRASVKPAVKEAREEGRPSCVVPPRPKAHVTLEPVFTDLEFTAPVGLVQAPRRKSEASGRWFLADQQGEVISFYSDASGGSVSGVVRTSLRDIVDMRTEGLDERGLLGLALHPRFPGDPRLFVTYTAKEEESGLVSRVSSFVVKDGALVRESENVLLSVKQPFPNHNGGGIAFGPDNYLYTSLGDGGSHDDPLGNGQNLQTLLGKLLRIDVNRTEGSRPYAIPQDNPFRDGGGLPEIYAYGLRNMWRFSFDRETGKLWGGDVGQGTWEEVDILERGANYGWNRMEGFDCFPPSNQGCDKSGLALPVHQYAHEGEEGRSITGGYVYRGSLLPNLVGAYIYGDYNTGAISALTRQGGRYADQLLVNASINISSFAEDNAGELYVLDWANGRVLRFGPGRSGPESFPKLLSETGCVDVERRQVTPVAVPYDVDAPFWSDGAKKQRYLVLPEGKRLNIEEKNAAQGDLSLPAGGMAIKTFELDGKPLEVRFYVRHEDGAHSGYTYAWRADGSDAELVEATRREQRNDVPWTFPGTEACDQCHTAGAGRTLGLTLPQLTTSLSANEQLRGLLSHSALTTWQNPPDAMQRWIPRGTAVTNPAPTDTIATNDAALLERRARVYLDVNCSHCHRPDGPGRVGLDLRFTTPLADTGVCEPVTLGELDSTSGKRVQPGDAKDSVLVQRMSRRDAQGMPPLATHLVDAEGVELISQWVNSLTACP